MDVADRIMGVESGNNPTARNSLSSAGGLGQFIDSTWLATLGKYRPDLVNSMSTEDLLALKTDPRSEDLQKDMTRRLVGENSQYLQQSGFEANPTNVYLAHFAGPGGATNILGSDPGTPIEGVLGQKAVAANPFLKGMTAGDVVSWAGRKIGGGLPTSTPSAAAPTAAGLLVPSSQGGGTQNDSTGLLGGLLAQRQPGQPQTTQDEGPIGLLKVAGLQPAARAARPMPQFMTRRRFG